MNKQQTKHSVGWWAGRVLGMLGGLVAILGIAGAIYQTLGVANDARKFPPPGQLIDVGGYKLHLYCTGASQPGAPTVILEALSGGSAVQWGWVQPELARTHRVCSYDRAGYGWSSPAPQTPDSEQTAKDLHTLLNKAGIGGPYVLVGHSIGGVHVRRFAALYPNEVVGLVLLDAAHPDQFQRHPEMTAEIDAFRAWMPVIRVAIRLGVGRLYFALGGEVDFQELPAREHDALAAFWSADPHWASQQQALDLVTPTGNAPEPQLGALGNLPLAVITAGRNTAFDWQANQVELASLSTNRVHIVIADASHVSLVFNPTHAAQVSALILQVVNAAHTGQSLP